MTTEEARQTYRNDRFASEQAGVEIVEARKQSAVCRMEVGGQHRNALGYVMGGALFTLADLAFAVAANWDGLKWVSLQSSIHFLTTAKEGSLQAVARCEKEGQTTCLYTIDITDGEGRKIAVVSTTGMKVK